MAAGAARILASQARRAEREDPANGLAFLLRLRDQLDELIDATGRSLHAQIGPTQLGEGVGIGRDVAWKRWGRPKGQAS